MLRGGTRNGQGAGTTITVVSGQPLTLRLPGTRGTGFWRLDGDLTPELSLSGRSTESVNKGIQQLQQVVPIAPVASQA